MTTAMQSLSWFVPGTNHDRFWIEVGGREGAGR